LTARWCHKPQPHTPRCRKFKRRGCVANTTA
jgi:hypothetical protein